MSITMMELLYKKKSYQVEINMMDILEVDTQRRIVKCEPLVTIRRLVDALIPMGWTVPIVPEIGDLTIGGLVMGGGIESTSHKYGLWQNICKSYEMVLADGSVVTCSKESDPDLFYVIPWSYGTFGFLTAVELDIIPFQPYIKLTYQPTFSLDEGLAVFEKETMKGSGNDSVEGIMFNRNEAVIMTGVFTDECESSKLNRIGLWYKKWFYTHVNDILDGRETVVEYIPTYDFFFRHNKPYYWLTNQMVPFGNHPVFRWLFGWLLPYNYGLVKFFDGIIPKEVKTNCVVQDFGLPIKHLKTAIEFYHEQLEIYPIWLCPALATDTGPIRSVKDTDMMHIDIGLYGFSPIKNFKYEETLRRLEKFARDYNGYQGLYAETLMTLEEFREMFDGTHYLKMRQRLKYCEEAFPEVYEKVSRIGRK